MEEGRWEFETVCAVDGIVERHVRYAERRREGVDEVGAVDYDFSDVVPSVRIWAGKILYSMDERNQRVSIGVHV